MPSHDLRPLARYGFAILLTAASVGARWLIDPYVQDRVPFAFLLLGLVVVAVRTGLGPSLLALGAGSLATSWLFLAPRHSLLVGDAAQQISLAMTLVLGLAIVVVGENLRRARRRARSFEELISDDYEHAGEVFVSTLGGVPSPERESPFNGHSASLGSAPLAGPLGRIISEAIPRIPETIAASNWEVLANGVPVVHVEVVRNGQSDSLGNTRKWVVTHFNPNVDTQAYLRSGQVVREYRDFDWS
ncbi:MAG: DUF4118 domain-containing protein [Planctomycetaceae bacterium]|nr:DUF4118 domain-containing protein [Planctomycetaceae bacterium]